VDSTNPVTRTSTEDIQLVVQLAKEIWTEHYTSIIGAPQVLICFPTYSLRKPFLKKNLKQGKKGKIIFLSNQIISLNWIVSYELIPDNFS